MRRFATGAAIACFAASLVSAPPAVAGPGDKEFYTLESHDPSAFLKAARAGADFVKGGRGRRFMIILVNAGVLVSIPGISTVQREVYDLRRKSPGLSIIACKETIDLLAKANKKRIPTFPGVTVKSCKNFRGELKTGGWEPAPGL